MVGALPQHLPRGHMLGSLLQQCMGEGVPGSRRGKSTPKVCTFVGFGMRLDANGDLKKNNFWNVKSRRSGGLKFMKTIRTGAFHRAVKNGCFAGTILADFMWVSDSRTVTLTIKLKAYVNRPPHPGLLTFTSRQGTEPGKAPWAPSGLLTPQKTPVSRRWHLPSIP